MNVRALLGATSIALALGAIVIGHGVVLPGLEQSVDAGLIDENLRVALGQPLERDLANVLLAASVALALAYGPWTRMSPPPDPSATAAATPPTPTRTTLGLLGTLTLLLVGVSATTRLWIVPELLAAWARVDAVTGRPAPALAQAERWSTTHELALAAALALLLAVLAVTTRHAGPRARAR